MPSTEASTKGAGTTVFLRCMSALAHASGDDDSLRGGRLERSAAAAAQ